MPIPNADAFPQGERARVGVTGRLVGNGGGACTVLLVNDAHGWLVYPHGDAQLAARISTSDAEKLARGILDARPTR